MKFILSSFLPTIKRRNILKNSLKMTNPAIGLDIGIPLNLLQNIFTNIHYGFDITTTKIIILQFLIGYYTYGYDRFLDASSENLDEKKKNDYKLLIEYKDFYQFSYNIAFSLITIILCFFDDNSIINIPFIILLLTSNYYKELKTEYPLFKPFYISLMWTLSTVILPCVLFDNSYSIINYPLDYLPVFFNILGLSNIADIKDTNEDKLNNVNTLPVQYGKENAIIFSLINIAISSLLFGLNINYLNRPIINSLFEIQNIFLSILAFYMSQNDENN